MSERSGGIRETGESSDVDEAAWWVTKGQNPERMVGGKKDSEYKKMWG